MKKYIAMLATAFALFVWTASAAPPKIEKSQKANVAKASEAVHMKAVSTWWFSPTDIGIPVVDIADISKAAKKVAYASDNPAAPPVEKKIEAYKDNFCQNDNPLNKDLLKNSVEANTCTIDTSPGNLTKAIPVMTKMIAQDPAVTDINLGKKNQEVNKAGADKINSMATDIGQRFQINMG